MKKEYKIKFGIRGGVMSQEYTIPTKTMAEKLCADLVKVLNATKTKDWYGVEEPTQGANPKVWKMHSNCPVKSWTSSTHFVSLEVHPLPHSLI